MRSISIVAFFLLSTIAPQPKLALIYRPMPRKQFTLQLNATQEITPPVVEEPTETIYTWHNYFNNQKSK